MLSSSRISYVPPVPLNANTRPVLHIGADTFTSRTRAPVGYIDPSSFSSSSSISTPRAVGVYTTSNSIEPAGFPTLLRMSTVKTHAGVCAIQAACCSLSSPVTGKCSSVSLASDNARRQSCSATETVPVPMYLSVPDGSLLTTTTVTLKSAARACSAPRDRPPNAKACMASSASVCHAGSGPQPYAGSVCFHSSDHPAFNCTHASVASMAPFRRPCLTVITRRPGGTPSAPRLTASSAASFSSAAAAAAFAASSAFRTSRSSSTLAATSAASASAAATLSRRAASAASCTRVASSCAACSAFTAASSATLNNLSSSRAAAATLAATANAAASASAAATRSRRAISSVCTRTASAFADRSAIAAASSASAATFISLASSRAAAADFAAFFVAATVAALANCSSAAAAAAAAFSANRTSLSSSALATISASFISR